MYLTVVVFKRNGKKTKYKSDYLLCNGKVCTRIYLLLNFAIISLQNFICLNDYEIYRKKGAYEKDYHRRYLALLYRNEMGCLPCLPYGY